MGSNPSWDASCLTHIPRALISKSGIVAEILPSPSESSPIRHSRITLTLGSTQCAILQDSWSDLRKLRLAEYINIGEGALRFQKFRANPQAQGVSEHFEN
jgi:hypothetical protein